MEINNNMGNYGQKFKSPDENIKKQIRDQLETMEKAEKLINWNKLKEEVSNMWLIPIPVAGRIVKAVQKEEVRRI